MVTNVPVRDPPNRSQTLHDETYVDRHNDYEIRKEGYVSQNFKDRKFRGKPDQSIERYLHYYKICAQKNKLSDQHRAEYSVNTLDGAEWN